MVQAFICPAGEVSRSQAISCVFHSAVKSHELWGLVDGWGSGCLRALVYTASCLLSLTCPQKALAGMLQAITLSREQLLHVVMGLRLAWLWDQEVRSSGFEIEQWGTFLSGFAALFSTNRLVFTAYAERSFKARESWECLFPQNVLWCLLFTTLPSIRMMQL